MQLDTRRPSAEAYDENGNYPSRSTGNHAVVVTDVKRNDDGRPSVVTIAEQWAARPGRPAGPVRIRELDAKEMNEYRAINRKK